MALPRSHPETMDPARRRLLGSYATPAPLADHLVTAALSPLLAPMERAARAGKLDDALRLRVLDPAVGDGVFLLAAGTFIARRLARASGLPIEEVRPLAGRCLLGVDIDPGAIRLARGRLREALGSPPRLVIADALEEDARSDLPGASFDAVIGNPPWGGWNLGLDRAAKESLRLRFRSARGLIDPAVLFLERSALWLRPGGRLGFVLPEYFLHKNYPAARAHLLEHYRLEELARWGTAFPGVSLEAVSLVAERAGGARRSRSAMVRCLPEGPAGRLVRVSQGSFASAPGHVLNLSLDVAGRRLLDRLTRRGTPLGSLLEAHEGIHSGNARSRIFVAPGAAAPSGVPVENLRPLVLGRSEIRPFALRPEGWRVACGREVLLPGQYANFGRPGWHAAPKILVRRTGDRLVAAVDREGVMASNNLFVARLKPGSPVPLDYLAAYLNSTLATWCFRAMVPRAGRLFSELKLTHLRRLPVPIPARPADAAEVVRLASRLDLLRLDKLFVVMARLTRAETRQVTREAGRI